MGGGGHDVSCPYKAARVIRCVYTNAPSVALSTEAKCPQKRRGNAEFAP
jgi:hypothetical protein